MNEKERIVSGMAGGKHVSGQPLTTEMAVEASPSLLQNSIDSAMVKIRPMATPLDQISRMGHVRPVESMEVDYYSVDTRESKDRVLSVEAGETLPGNMGVTVKVKVKRPELFEPSETFVARVGDKMYSAYICKKDGEGNLVCMSPVNDDLINIGAGTEIVRMGRAATQLDVQTPQFSSLPTKQTNLCQIFKMQIEQSTVMKLSHKEIGWDLSDQQEAALYDMRLGMERQFLFGQKGTVYDPEKQENVTLTEGIWHQAGKDVTVQLEGFGKNEVVDLLRSVFTDNSGSRRKVLIGGSELIAALNKIDATNVITSRDQVTKWGIDFSELQSKFGRLYVVFSDIFDSVGMAGDGIVIDPEYIQKHVFMPMSAERLDLRGSGQRNTEAVVLTEASCLTLRYPQAHARILGK